MQLHVTVPGGVLQPVRHRQISLVPLAGLPAVHPPAVGAGAGVARLALEVSETGVHGLPDHLVDLGDQGGPILVAVFVACLAGQAGVLAEGGVEDRDRLGQRNRQVEEEGTLAGLLGSLGPQFASRSAVACGSAASSLAYRSAALRPLPGGLPSGVPSGAQRSPNSRS